MSLPSSYTWKAKKKIWTGEEPLSFFLKNSAENMKKLFRFHLGLLTDEGQSKNRSWQVSEYGWDDWRKWRKEIEDERFVSSLDQHLTFSRKECRDAPLYTLHKLYRSALEECVWGICVRGGCQEKGTVRENASIDCGLLSYRWQLWHQIKADRSWRTARCEICCLWATNKAFTIACSARTLE